MKFYERTTTASAMKQHGFIPKDYDSRTLSDIILEAYGRGVPVPKYVAHQLQDEADWIDDGMPYYSVWPVITDCLLRTPLAIPGDSISLPRKPILLRFSQDKPFITNGLTLKSILANETLVEDAEGKDHRSLVLWCDFGEVDMSMGFPLMVGTYRVFRLDMATVQDALDASKRKFDKITDQEEEALLDAIRITLAVAMLNESTEFFEPDVLSKDSLKYERTKDASIVARAHRRGKIGWHLGRQTELVPHVRRPHFAIRWTGVGRVKPVLTPIRGSVVKRRRLVEVPTGYMDEDAPNG